MNKSGDELTKLVSLWQTSYFMGQAILEDYAQRMSKLEGTDAKEIISTITAATQKKFEEYKKTNLK